MPLRAQRTTPRHGLRSSFVSDRRLVQRITRGDDAAFSELLARYRSTLYATAYAVLLDPEQVAVVVAAAIDRRLVQRITRGDDAAFSELLARYRSTLYATAYAVLLDPEQVAVVVADAFEEARRNAAEFLDPQGSVSGWLTHLTRLRIARHHAA